MLSYSPFDPGVQDDPYPTYRRLRDEAPAYRHPEHGFWALSRYADVVAALRDPSTFSSADGPGLEALDRQALEVSSFLAMDPPRHDALRAVLVPFFSKRAVAELEERVRGLSRAYLAPILEAGEADLVAGLAGPLPMDVVSGLLGVPESDRPRLRELADLVVQRADGLAGIPPESMRAGMELLRYFAVHVQRARGKAAEGLTRCLLEAREVTPGLDDVQLVAIHFLLGIAGAETTTKLLGNALYWATRFPDQGRRVRHDPRLIPAWVEETLRYEGSSQMVARTATREVELHGEVVPEGARVALLLGSANRDERAFEDPDRYEVGRVSKHALAFGHGVHFCLGAHLARLEARVCLEELLGATRDVEVDTARAVRARAANVRGFSVLPLRVERS